MSLVRNHGNYERFDGIGDPPEAGSTYQPTDYEEMPHEEGVMIHQVETNIERNVPVPDLDLFCFLSYHYHQSHGLFRIVLREMFSLHTFVFSVVFAVLVIYGIDYPVMFRDQTKNDSTPYRVQLSDIFVPVNTWVYNFNILTWICLLFAFLFWTLRFVKSVYNISQFWDIRRFYNKTLRVEDCDLDNQTWYEVLSRIRYAQREHQLCIHKRDLTELDIYHRILRFQNYFIAMINKNVLPIKLDIPFVGNDIVFFTRFLRYNMEFLLFWGPWSPFENNWHLKEDYKKIGKRHDLAATLSRKIFWVGIANLLLSPFILFWQFLHLFFNYAELIKREPGTLGSYRWSLYAKYYLRHFNELDHELNARLNRAYRPASKYMRSFTSPLMAIIAKHFSFVCGSILAVIITLTIYDEDVIFGVEHMFTIFTVLGIIVAICRVFIPDENMVRCPELLLQACLAHIHYSPDTWRGQAHTYQVRNEFSQLFQYQAVYLLEMVLSPLITPYILIFKLRPRALDIVDFFRNFTVAVVGVGDVCSFAQMDVRKHGHPDWRAGFGIDPVEAVAPMTTNQYTQAEDGKTELSLIHFTLTNPNWKMPVGSQNFVQTLKRNAAKDLTGNITNENPLYRSIHSVSSLGAGYQSLMQDIFNNTMLSQSRSGVAPANTQQNVNSSAVPNYEFNQQGDLPVNEDPVTVTSPLRPQNVVYRGGVNRAEGPLFSERGLLYSLHQNMANFPSMGASMFGTHASPSLAGDLTDNPIREFVAADMSLSTMYLHELHQRQIRRRGVQPDVTQRSLWQRPHQAESIDGVAIVVPQPAVSVAENTPLLNRNR